MSDYLEPIEQLPAISVQFISVLERVFRLRLPSPATSERDDLYHAGQQSVIDFLRKAQEDQVERARD